MFAKIREEVLDKLIIDGVYRSGKLNSKQNIGLVEKIDNLTIPGFEKRSEKILALRLNLSEAPKCYCGNYCKIAEKQTMSMYCSHKCAANSPSTIKKRADTWNTRGGKILSDAHKLNLSSSLKHHFTANDVWNKGNFTEKIKVISTDEEIRAKKEKRRLSAQLAGKSRKQKTIKTHLAAAPDTWKNVFFNRKDNIDYVNLTHVCCSTTINVQLQTVRKWNWGEGLCKTCNPIFRGISKAEIALTDFIRTLSPDVQSSVKLPSGLELDAFIPSKKIAVEYDGLYWHSEKAGYEKDKHLRKTEECEKNGIKLIHVFEDEWVLKEEIVKSRLRSILFSIENKIFARNLNLDFMVTNKEAREFLTKTHLAGFCVSKFRFGLRTKDGELLALMTFGKPRFDKKVDWELIRYCTKLNTTIVGGASRLLHAFSRQETGTIISYADRRWSNGNVYKNLGFTLLAKTAPSFSFFKGITRFNRQTFQKKKLATLFPAVYNIDKTGDQMLNELNFNKIWDCGNLKFIKTL